MDFDLFFAQFLFDEKQPLLFHTGFFLSIFSVFMLLYAFFYDKKKLRYVLIISFGFYFYYKASGNFLLLLLTTISADYLFSIGISRAQNKIYKKIFLTIGILFSLSFLIYFKYAGFFEAQYATIVGNSYKAEEVILPIGISFYTFQSISYLVDTYYQKFERPSFGAYLLYMTYFPHLVAGPIVRAKDFLPQIESENADTSVSLTNHHLHEAFYLILKGFVKKAIIGDFVAQYADIVFASPADYLGTAHILATLCYTLQIFCDFSGYTDMAIGISLLLGYRLSKNFDSPYRALNITDFWRKWHISLSFWLRDYVYIPLGGSRKGFYLQLLFLLITMLVGGFWHGADWKFIFWGAAHGFLLIFHKLFLRYTEGTFWRKIPAFIAWLLTFSLVALLWIPFRAATMADALFMFKSIFTTVDLPFIRQLFFNNPLLFVLLFLGYAATILPTIWKEKIQTWYFDTDFTTKIFFFAIVIQIMLQIKSETVQPFIYFQF
jgi:alginate O-acetyltransferase complex protein AlgI